jgi:benzoyl-CoA reductase/2-hydroxyglutaryl-CoA dehydratase subunit BcrC/BadD/HgdB
MKDPIQYTLKSAYKADDLYSQLFVDANEARSKGKFVALVTFLGPWEILWSMDVIPLSVECFGIKAGSEFGSARSLEAAEACGLSSDLCTYLGSAYGYVMERSTFARDKANWALPTPDFTIIANTLCDDQTKVLNLITKEYGCPSFSLDVPFDASGAKPADLDIDWVEFYAGQLRDMIPFLEEQTGRKFELARLEACIQNTYVMNSAIAEIYELRKAKPVPMTCTDAWGALFFPHVSLAGTEQGANFLLEVLDEVQQRVDRKEAAVASEKYRLMWHQAPPWQNVGLLHYLENRGGVFVMETGMYRCAFADTLAPEGMDPFEWLARRYMATAPNRKKDFRINEDVSLDLVRDYQIDGVVALTEWSCRPCSIGLVDIKRAHDDIGVPYLILHGDQLDDRMYNDQQAKARLESFFEEVESRHATLART